MKQRCEAEVQSGWRCENPATGAYATLSLCGVHLRQARIGAVPVYMSDDAKRERLAVSSEPTERPDA